MPVVLTARVIDTQANQSFDVTFERFPVRIGRNQLNDLHIDRPYISQFHAAIDLSERQILVKDLGSTNGTIFAGQRLSRDTPEDVSREPKIRIGPIEIHLALTEMTAKREKTGDGGTLLDLRGESLNALVQPPKQGAPGAEEPFVQQVVPYLEAYRAAWGGVYRLIWDHLARLPPELRQPYLRRLSQDHAAVLGEKDFQQIAQYYGVNHRTLRELAPPDAAYGALMEMATRLIPGGKPLDDVAGLLTFARRLRDTMEVFLKSFVGLRDGYKTFQEEVHVQSRDRSNELDPIATARDDKELGQVLLTPMGGPDAAHRLHDLFWEMKQHQVALLVGIMEGVKSLLSELSPEACEAEYERKGKKGGLFSNKYEALWEIYRRRHGNYSGEDKEIFRKLFGPQFAAAYAAATEEDYGPNGPKKT
jgi:type VI secretion system protein ImpI